MDASLVLLITRIPIEVYLGNCVESNQGLERGELT